MPVHLRITGVEYTFSGYRIFCVYGKVDSGLARELVDFWIDNKAIQNPQRAKARVPQVALIARNSAGRLAGVSTVYISMLNRNQRYYFYRMFIQPTDRVSGMMRFMTLRTRDYLRGLKVEDKPQGMAIVTENRKLMDRGMRREFERAGFTCLGKTPKGFDLWISEF